MTATIPVYLVPQDIKPNELQRVTQWAYPTELMNTEYSPEPISFAVWLAMEVNRWAANGRHAEIRAVHGELALFAKCAFQMEDSDDE